MKALRTIVIKVSAILSLPKNIAITTLFSEDVKKTKVSLQVVLKITLFEHQNIVCHEFSRCRWSQKSFPFSGIIKRFTLSQLRVVPEYQIQNNVINTLMKKVILKPYNLNISLKDFRI